MPKLISKNSMRQFEHKEYGDGNIRSSVDFSSVDGRYRFVISTRMLIDVPSDFSVVFRYVDSEQRSYIIRRYNGNHGRHYHRNTNRYISGPHIHTITEKAQDGYRKDETEAVETREYVTLEQAIAYALSDLNIKFEVQDDSN